MRRITLHPGDNRISLAAMNENSVDSVVCDPPYGYVSMFDRFGKEGSAPARDHQNDGSFGRISKGFLGRTWDGTGIERDPSFWKLVLRVMKPGAFFIAFTGARTYHRIASAVEDAGFIIHPLTGWIYGQGMSLAPELSKMIDKHLQTPGEIVPTGNKIARLLTGAEQNARGEWTKDNGRKFQPGTYIANSTEAQKWKGWRPGAHARRTALEPIIFAQKVMSERSAAANVLKWGVGATNIDDCRTEEGRHPANVLVEDSAEVTDLLPVEFFNRFPASIFHPKADKNDRADSGHPSVKPITLIQYLVRHVTPPGGTVLDPFAGSGTTGVAALREGFNCILMEAETEYVEFLKNRFVNDLGHGGRNTNLSSLLDSPVLPVSDLTELLS